MPFLRLALAAALAFAAHAAGAAPRHAIAMHGEPALGPDFTHFPYADPEAPKGGRIDYAVVGTFDNVNPFIVQGSAVRGLRDLQYGDNVYESLMARSADEPFTLYPLIASSVDTDDSRSFVEFTIDERARFSDGVKVTPDDVIFTFELLRDHGLPRYARSVKKIARMEALGGNRVRFTFAETGDRELPLILALMPVLPRHAIAKETFAKSTLKPFPGTGPYVIETVKAGELLVLRRNPDYWGRQLPAKAGFDNFDEIRISYYGNENALFEGFKKGLVDVFFDRDPGRWATGYGFPAVEDGRIVKDSVTTGLPSGMYGFVFNSRRPVFAERAVRAALADSLDFEWVNRTLFAGAYRRTASFFDGSELASTGRPAGPAELALLAPFPEAVTPDILAGSWRPPSSDGSGRDRAFLRRVFDRLVAAGYRLDGKVMVGPDGTPLAFDILLRGNEGEQIALAWQRTLALIGIAVTLRSVDPAQYTQSLTTYDFDVIAFNYTASLSPGAEQVSRWGSAFRDQPGTFNYAGVASPAVDALIAGLIAARSRDEFVAAARAYDRVLLSGAWLVPLYHQPEQWLARWARIGRPQATPLSGYQLSTWWRSGS